MSATAPGGQLSINNVYDTTDGVGKAQARSRLTHRDWSSFSVGSSLAQGVALTLSYASASDLHVHSHL